MVCELGLVLEPDPVMGLIVLHGVLQDNYLQHFLGMGVGKFTLGDEGRDMGRQGMDTLIGESVDIGVEFIPEVPKMLLRLDSSTDSIKGKPGHPLTLQGDGLIVDEGLGSLSIFTLEHHLSCLVPVLQSSASVLMLRASR